MKFHYRAFIFLLLLLHGCASLSTPGGGPKDVQPPVLLQSSPSNNQTGFTGKTIELTFNEMVLLNNPKEEIIISPSPGKLLDFKMKGGTKVTIHSPEGWKDSTTYSILFREGIQDATEKNVPPELKLAFSTGPSIDSLRIRGVVTDLLKGTPADKMTVGIYASDTFDLFTDVPGYFTKSDKKGNFMIENIKAGSYKIYAFDDKNKNLIVESRSERYGFRAQDILLDSNVDSIHMGLVMVDSRPLKITAIRNVGTLTRVRFNKFIEDYSIQPDSSLVHSYGDNQTEIMLWNPPSTTDSLRLHLHATDSIENKLDTIFYIKKTDVNPVNETFKWTTGSPNVIAETGKFSMVLKSNKPVIEINFDSIYVAVDTTSKIHFSKEDIIVNMMKKEIAVSKQFDKLLFKTEKEPKLVLNTGKGFIISADNDSTRASSKPVDITWPEQTGIILIETATREKSYIIQLLNKEGNTVNSIQNTAKFTFKSLLPAEYQIRIIIDTNKNGKWDVGNIKMGIEPEKVRYYKNPAGKQSFPVRANWELGPLKLSF